MIKMCGLYNQYSDGVLLSTLSDEDIAKKLYPPQMRENIINSANMMTEKRMREKLKNNDLNIVQKIIKRIFNCG